MSNKLNFAVVEFSGEHTVDIAPSSWLASKHECWWPSDQGPGFNQLQRKAGSLPRKSWKKYPSRIVKIFDSFEDAEKCMLGFATGSSSENETEDESSDTESTVLVKKEVMETLDNDETCIEMPEQSALCEKILTSPGRKRPKRCSYKAGLNKSYRSTEGNRAQYQIFNEDEFIIPTNRRESVSLSQSLPTVITETTMPHPCTSCKQTQDYVKQILKTVHTLSNEVRELSSVVRSQMNVKLPEKQDKMNYLPAKTVSDLTYIDLLIKDEAEFARLESYLSLLGGKDEKAATRRVLTKLISHNLALQLSWVGSDIKQAFSVYTNVLHLVAVCVRKNHGFEDCTQAAVEDSIKRWLRYAGDRGGGRTRRRTEDKFYKDDSVKKIKQMEDSPLYIS